MLAPVGLVVAATIGLGAYYSRSDEAAIALVTAAASRGDVVTAITSTGTLQAVTTVQVGSQVSGSIEALYADFNSIVRKGQLLARLDQSTFATGVEQARASLVSAEAEAERLRVASSAAAVALSRARELSAKQLLPAADLQSAETASLLASAQVVGADARVAQAKSALQQAQVTMGKTVIASPIDGVVIARNVDVGQTVAASMSAPTLFVIAADLSDMQLSANVDESDVGQVQPGQAVTFRVDAYPSDTFAGRVAQLRLNPTTVQNVVTYSAIIDAPNPALKLKPGMTATVTIEVARRDGVMRVPSAALRFKPGAEVLAKYAAEEIQPNGPAIWVSDGSTIAPVPVKPGASDGSFTEILDAPFPEGTTVVVRVSAPAGATAPSSSGPTNNPLLPSPRQRR